MTFTSVWVCSAGSSAPSQLAPSGMRFSTRGAPLISAATLWSTADTDSASPRGSLVISATRLQSMLALLAASSPWMRLLSVLDSSFGCDFDQSRLSSSSTSKACRYSCSSCQPNTNGWLTTCTVVPGPTMPNSFSTSSGYSRMQPWLERSPTPYGLLVPWM